jgi:hypothetical protein
MNPLRWLLPRPTHPILLRLDLGGLPCPPSVEVESEWLPSRTRRADQVLASSSMVLVPWRGDAQEAVLSVRVGKHVGRARITREANSDGLVLDLRLDAAV